MNDEKRKDLLLQHERLTAKKDQIIKRLNVYGETLSDLGTCLQDEPETVIFSGPPAGHGTRPSPEGRSFRWDAIPTVQTIDQLIIDLLEAEKQLRGVQAELQN